MEEKVDDPCVYHRWRTVRSAGGPSEPTEYTTVCADCGLEKTDGDTPERKLGMHPSLGYGYGLSADDDE